MDATGSPYPDLLIWSLVLAVAGLTGWRVMTSHRSGVRSRVRNAAIMASGLSAVACVGLLVQLAVASHYEFDKSIVYLSVLFFAVALFGVVYFALAALRGVYPLVNSTLARKSDEG
jgi:hypothetical protein